MKIAISVAVESDVAERPVQRLLSRLVRHHEVEVNRRVFARGVNRGAGSAGQDGLDAVPVQSCPYHESDLLEGRLLAETFLAGSEGLQNPHPRFKSGRRLHSFQQLAGGTGRRGARL